MIPNFKVRVNESQSRIIQRLMFSLGKTWADGAIEIRNALFLFYDGTGGIRANAEWYYNVSTLPSYDATVLMSVLNTLSTANGRNETRYQEVSVQIPHFKVRVNASQSREIQSLMFSHGASWLDSNGSRGNFINDAVNLYYNGTLSCMTYDNIDLFEEGPEPLYEADELIDILRNLTSPNMDSVSFLEFKTAPNGGQCRRIQELIFSLGGTWETGTREFLHINSKLAFIENVGLKILTSDYEMDTCTALRINSEVLIERLQRFVSEGRVIIGNGRLSVPNVRSSVSTYVSINNNEVDSVIQPLPDADNISSKNLADVDDVINDLKKWLHF